MSDETRRAKMVGQATGFGAALLILALALGAWFLVGGKLVLVKKNDGFGATMITLP